MSTSQKLFPAHSAREKCRSRVVPGSSVTIAVFAPTMRLNRADLPTFGRPMSATIGVLISTCSQGVDKVVRRADRHRERRADVLECGIIEEHAPIVDRLGRDQRFIEIISAFQRSANIRTDE